MYILFTVYALSPIALNTKTNFINQTTGRSTSFHSQLQFLSSHEAHEFTFE